MINTIVHVPILVASQNHMYRVYWGNHYRRISVNLVVNMAITLDVHKRVYILAEKRKCGLKSIANDVGESNNDPVS